MKGTTRHAPTGWAPTRLTAVSLAALIVAGCSSDTPNTPKVEPVTGKVLVKGSPAAGAVVTFHPVLPGPDTRAPRGVVEADGTFRLTTYTTSDGAMAGEYAVTLVWPEKDDPDLEARGIEVKDRLQNRYKDPKRPFRKVTVRPGSNDLEPFVIP